MNNFANLSLVSAGELVDSVDVAPPDFVLRGLESSHIGMLIAAPEMGKSHLCFSIAIEHSTQFKLLGISAASKPQKTLLVSAEDSVGVIKKQLAQKLSSLPAKVKKLARDNIYPFSASLPLVASGDSPSQEQAAVQAYTERLIELIKENEISLVVIDTVSEVIGSCDEVKHDRVIKNAFQKIARESGSAILLVHHVNKAEIKGENEISMASGAGLTTVMRLSKLIMGITSHKDCKRLSYLKANYLSPDEKKGFGVAFSGSIIVNTSLEPALKDIKSKKEPERPKPLIVKPSRSSSDARKIDGISIRNAF